MHLGRCRDRVEGWTSVRGRRSVCVTVRLATRLGTGPKETSRMLGTSPRMT